MVRKRHSCLALLNSHFLSSSSISLRNIPGVWKAASEIPKTEIQHPISQQPDWLLANEQGLTEALSQGLVFRQINVTMDELLSPVSRTYYNRPAGNDAPLLQEVKSQHFSTKAPAKPTLLASSVVDVTEALKNEPDYDTLISALKLLLRDGERLGNFHIGAPGPEAAKLIHILVTEIAPNYWAQLADEDGADRSLFLEALRNLAGLKAILLRLHTLIQQEQQQSNTEAKRPDILLNLGVTLQLLNEVLSGDDTVTRLWTSTSVGADALKRRILAKDLVQLVGGGRLPALPAQAETLLTKTVKATASWSASGVEYSKWLIRNIIDLSRKTEAAEGKKLAADLLSKAMHLGYLGKCSASYP